MLSKPRGLRIGRWQSFRLGSSCPRSTQPCSNHCCRMLQTGRDHYCWSPATSYPSAPCSQWKCPRCTTPWWSSSTRQMLCCSNNNTTWHHRRFRRTGLRPRGATRVRPTINSTITTSRRTTDITSRTTTSRCPSATDRTKRRPPNSVRSRKGSRRELHHQVKYSLILNFASWCLLIFVKFSRHVHVFSIARFFSACCHLKSPLAATTACPATGGQHQARTPQQQSAAELCTDQTADNHHSRHPVACSFCHHHFRQ